MKLKNHTRLPDYFLRRIISWCCKEIGYSTRRIDIAEIRNRKNDGRLSGHAQGSRKFCISIPRNFQTDEPENVLPSDLALESLVRVIAHEVFHLWAHHEGIRSRRNRKTRGSSERQTIRHEIMVLEAYRKCRLELLDKWSVRPKRKSRARTNPPKSKVESRAKNARKKLSEWQRKHKLAQTKLKFWRKKVKYYDRTISAKRSA